MNRYLVQFIALLCGAMSCISQAAIVENVHNFRAPDYTRLVFDLSEYAEHNIFTLDKPDRIVLDLSGSTIQGKLPSLDFSNTPLLNIRSGVRNNTDLRIVLDLDSAVKTQSFMEKNEQGGNRLIIDIYDNNYNINSNPAPVVSLSANALTNEKRDIVIAIAAGHGGKAPGAVGVNKLQEKKVVLAIARKIEKIIDQTPGYKAVMIREGDYSVGLRERIKIAHENRADLFIAIHADAFKNSEARGATVYALSLSGSTSEQAKLLAEKENSDDLILGLSSVSLSDKDEVLSSVLLDLSMTATIASSLEVGDKIISSLSHVTRMRRTNVEQANFVVLRSPDIPSLLIEAGYITNPSDARNLDSSSHQQKFAGAVVNGITSYFYTTPLRGTWVSWQKENGAAPSSYIVSSGDSLSMIAKRHNISLNSLKNANNLNQNTIYIGQKLNIPSGLITPLAQVSYYEHTIARGETLSGIAHDYSISLQRIRDSNQLNGDNIMVGQTLRIPSS